MKSGNVKDLTQAWDLYYHVFRRISKQLPQVGREVQFSRGVTVHVVNTNLCFLVIQSIQIQYSRINCF